MRWEPPPDGPLEPGFQEVEWVVGECRDRPIEDLQSDPGDNGSGVYLDFDVPCPCCKRGKLTRVATDYGRQETLICRGGCAHRYSLWR